jgi:hypothetical protein
LHFHGRFVPGNFTLGVAPALIMVRSASLLVQIRDLPVQFLQTVVGLYKSDFAEIRLGAPQSTHTSSSGSLRLEGLTEISLSRFSVIFFCTSSEIFDVKLITLSNPEV